MPSLDVDLAPRPLAAQPARVSLGLGLRLASRAPLSCGEAACVFTVGCWFVGAWLDFYVLRIL